MEVNQLNNCTSRVRDVAMARGRCSLVRRLSRPTLRGVSAGRIGAVVAPSCLVQDAQRGEPRSSGGRKLGQGSATLQRGVPHRWIPWVDIQSASVSALLHGHAPCPLLDPSPRRTHSFAAHRRACERQRVWVCVRILAAASRSRIGYTALLALLRALHHRGDHVHGRRCVMAVSVRHASQRLELFGAVMRVRPLQHLCT
ncbi:hypothetical protein OH77DRAFT_1023439 [Trametes cingulata]|nr:hypothetical protein OH77DRAFT_1023439 [Trametes cingulata]